MNNATSIFWFRQDLRLEDNPALNRAIENGQVMPIYIFSKNDNIGAASKWWLHHSLKSLNKSLNNHLNFYIGDAHEIILDLIKKHNITSLYWNRRYDPKQIKTDKIIKTYLSDIGVKVNSFNGSLLWEPWEVKKPDNSYYKVYSAFYRKARICEPAYPEKKPTLPNPTSAGNLSVDSVLESSCTFKYTAVLRSESPLNSLPEAGYAKSLFLLKDHHNQTMLDDLALLPEKNWANKFCAIEDIGEEAANRKLSYFLKNNLKNYKENRNYPSLNAISRLSAHLHFGEISPNKIWHSAKEFLLEDSYIQDLEQFLAEIAWREFSYYLLYHFPDLDKENFQAKFDHFPWINEESLLKKWQKGNTGIPIIDAGMRELWQTGFMHNRVRMIVASFLVKNLLIHWHHGKDWFFDCLLDADLANNSASWQWVAGSGADAAPYYRIFNPILQGEKFDIDGHYTRKFVPELAKLPNKYLFKPWLAPENILLSADVKLGINYPYPIVDLDASRKLALKLYKSI